MRSSSIHRRRTLFLHFYLCRVFLRFNVFGRPSVKRFALCYRTVVLSVCLFLTLVYFGETVGRIKMKLGTQVGRGPGHNVLDGDPAPPPQGGRSPQFSAHICCSLCRDQDATWYGGTIGLGPGDFVRWGPRSPSQKGGRGPSPIFGSFLLWPNG